jgi:hypothetical protein
MNQLFNKTFKSTYLKTKILHIHLDKNSNLFTFHHSIKRFSSNKDSEITDDLIIKPVKKEKNDPHQFQIYKNIKPSLGARPAPEPFPDYFRAVLPPRPDQQYHKTGHPDSFRFALKNNYPIIRESVSAFYRVNVNGMNYHVFNGARVVSLCICIFKIDHLYLLAIWKNTNICSSLFTREKFTFI